MAVTSVGVEHPQGKYIMERKCEAKTKRKRSRKEGGNGGFLKLWEAGLSSKQK